MGHDELSSLLKIDASEIGNMIQEVYNFLSDDSMLKFELILLSRECNINISDKMYLNATRTLIEKKNGKRMK